MTLVKEFTCQQARRQDQDLEDPDQNPGKVLGEVERQHYGWNGNGWFVSDNTECNSLGKLCTMTHLFQWFLNFTQFVIINQKFLKKYVLRTRFTHCILHMMLLIKNMYWQMLFLLKKHGVMKVPSVQLRCCILPPHFNLSHLRQVFSRVRWGNTENQLVVYNSNVQKIQYQGGKLYLGNIQLGLYKIQVVVCTEMEKAADVADAVSAIFFKGVQIFSFSSNFFNGFCLFLCNFCNFCTILSIFCTYFVC